MIRLFLICTLFFALMGCHSNAAEVKHSNPTIHVSPGNGYGADPLIKTINEYYNLEKNESWDKTYEYRTPLFRQSVMKDSYIKEMSKDNEGWHLIRFEIVSLNIENNRAVAKIRFTEVSPREVNFFWIKIKKHNMIIEEDTKWKIYDGTWFSLDPGDRTHLYLNEELVLE